MPPLNPSEVKATAVPEWLKGHKRVPALQLQGCRLPTLEERKASDCLTPRFAQLRPLRPTYDLPQGELDSEQISVVYPLQQGPKYRAKVADSASFHQQVKAMQEADRAQCFACLEEPAPAQCVPWPFDKPTFYILHLLADGCKDGDLRWTG